MKYSKVMTWLGCLALAVVAPLSWAQDPVGITGIEVSNLSAEKQVVKVNFNRTAPSPASFLINTPPRIAFDFANTTNESGKSTLPINGNVLRQINIAEGAGRTRVVLNLQKMAVYAAKAEGQSVLITVDSATTDMSASRSTHFSDARQLHAGKPARAPGRPDHAQGAPRRPLCGDPLLRKLVRIQLHDAPGTTERGCHGGRPDHEGRADLLALQRALRSVVHAAQRNLAQFGLKPSGA